MLTFVIEINSYQNSIGFKIADLKIKKKNKNKKQGIAPAELLERTLSSINIVDLILFTDTLTCYTCVNVSDNLTCNQYAIDRPCARGMYYRY